jgi:hypothetical protein
VALRRENRGFRGRRIHAVAGTRLARPRVVEPKEAYMKSVAKSDLKAQLERAGVTLELGA